MGKVFNVLSNQGLGDFNSPLSDGYHFLKCYNKTKSLSLCTWMRNHYTALGNVHKYSYYRNQYGFPQKKIKLPTELSYDLDNITPRNIPKCI